MYKLAGLLIIGLAVLFQQHVSDAEPTLTGAEMDSLWENFKAENGLVYTNLAQEMGRRALFEDEHRRILAHNADPGRTFDMALNHFAVMTPAERERGNGYRPVQTTENAATTETPQPPPPSRRMRNKRQATTTTRRQRNNTLTTVARVNMTCAPGFCTTGASTTTRSTTSGASTTTRSTTSGASTTSVGGIPNSWDWSVRNPGEVQVVHPPKDQGSCGSCWAFATTGVTEGAYALKKGIFKRWSEKQFVDCSRGFNNGCNGGHTYYAIHDFRVNGSHLESEYPYTQQQDTCRLNASTARANFEYNMTRQFRQGGCAVANANCSYGEEDLKAWLYNYGPLAVALEVVQDFYSYRSGIYTTTACANLGPTAANHAVVLVGYGESNGTKFWKMKNSWGTGWGESGYARFPRDGRMMCNFGREATWAILT